MKGRFDHPAKEHWVERDLELGRALATLEEPQLPEDFADRMRIAVDKERRRNRRRAGLIELVTLFVICGLVGAVAAWRYIPPASGTLQQIERTVTAYRAALAPPVPIGATQRGRLTPAERASLLRRVESGLRGSSTPAHARDLLTRQRMPESILANATEALAGNQGWPTTSTPARGVSIDFLHRRWDGRIVIRLVDGRGVEVGAGRYTVRRIDDRWLVDAVARDGD